MHRLLTGLLAFHAAVASLAQPSAPPTMRLHDRWGRDITTRGITLLDWEGPIANPAIQLEVRFKEAPAKGSDLYFHGSNSRIHFDRSAPDDFFGIGKRIKLDGTSTAANFLVSIFPDRDFESESHKLVVQLFGPDRVEKERIEVPVRVVDQDRPAPEPLYSVLLDFTEDRTGWFSDPEVQQVIRQAADDWQYFIGGTRVDEVPAGAERIQVWNEDGFKTRRSFVNPKPYTGILLYITGIRHDEMRAGGAPSQIGGFHTWRGKELPLRRSGSVEFDVRGNWNQMGWLISRGDQDWWHSGSMRAEQSDLYSIALHEMGHALCFEKRYPVQAAAHRDGGFPGDALKAYLGVSPPVDSSDHLVGAIDPVSRYGVFGREYQAEMKVRRWLLTKAHLLALESCGYTIRRDITPFQTLKAEGPIKLNFRVGDAVSASLKAAGGVPDYFFKVLSGTLPDGLILDSFSGTLSGKPTGAGSYEFVASVEDNDPTTPPLEIKVSIEVKS